MAQATEEPSGTSKEDAIVIEDPTGEPLTQPRIERPYRGLPRPRARPPLPRSLERSFPGPGDISIDLTNSDDEKPRSRQSSSSGLLYGSAPTIAQTKPRVSRPASKERIWSRENSKVPGSLPTSAFSSVGGEENGLSAQTTKAMVNSINDKLSKIAYNNNDLISTNLATLPVRHPSLSAQINSLLNRNSPPLDLDPPDPPQMIPSITPNSQTTSARLVSNSKSITDPQSTPTKPSPARLPSNMSSTPLPNSGTSDLKSSPSRRQANVGLPIKSAVIRLTKSASTSSPSYGWKERFRQSKSLSRPTTQPQAHLIKETAQEARSYPSSAQWAEESPQPGLHSAYVPTAGRETNEPIETGIKPINQGRDTHPCPSLKDVDILNVENSAKIVKDCLEKHLIDVREFHSSSVRNMLRTQRNRLNREHRTGTRSTSPSTFTNALKSPFADIKPIQVATSSYTGHAEVMTVCQELTTKKGSKLYLSAPVTSYRSSGPSVPAFHEYVSLKKNILVGGDRKMIYWPYLGEGSQELSIELEKHYDLEMDDHERHIVQAEQCRLYQPHVEAFFAEVEVTWEDILFWLLAQPNDIREICSDQDLVPAELEKKILGRRIHCQEDFDRDAPKWKAFFSTLPRPCMNKLLLANIVCSEFLDLFGLSIWQLARRSKVVQIVELGMNEVVKAGSFLDKDFTYRQLSCRLCHQYYCNSHGEIRDEPGSPRILIDPSNQSSCALTNGSASGSEYEGSQSSDKPDNGYSLEIERSSETDTVTETSQSNLHELNGVAINYRSAVTVATRGGHRESTSTIKYIPLRTSDEKWWADKSNTEMMPNRRPFYPCNHDDSCEDAQCRCFREKILCEKSCGCAMTCERRFRGCDCAKKPGSKIPICRTNHCECFRLNRECDEDLCGRCGAREVLDPVNRYDDDLVRYSCCNVQVTRGIPKRTLLGKSELHGFGLYAGEDIKKGDFISEYTGELLGYEEGERRATEYTHNKTSYTFNLTREQEVDATRAGNKLRFINNAPDRLANCQSKLVLCNSVVRIGLFAKRQIKSGEELFFDYCYPPSFIEDFLLPGQKAEAAGKRATQLAKIMAAKKAQPRTKKPSVVGRTESRKKLSTPERRAQTQNAREAKLAKLSKKGAQSQYDAAPTAAHTKIQSVIGSLPWRNDDKSSSAESKNASSSDIFESQSQEYIQNTDIEDEDYTESEGEDYDEINRVNDLQETDNNEEGSERGWKGKKHEQIRSNLRRKTASDSVAVVRSARLKRPMKPYHIENVPNSRGDRDGHRDGARQKRKRRIIDDDDDDDE
ncbi:hypothetical protein CC78DRAFT_573183 [Lojkania enalia]|uniref:SET domain-containing protein n=1 Tax=Lojkania enalia TaxID=147567 RepID=A0A9P4NCQ2_9PLEO|nr:hypothetical protein CC78DRAFT_573183 [Didymosphaeria enalia]